MCFLISLCLQNIKHSPHCRVFSRTKTWTARFHFFLLESRSFWQKFLNTKLFIAIFKRVKNLSGKRIIICHRLIKVFFVLDPIMSPLGNDKYIWIQIKIFHSCYSGLASSRSLKAVRAWGHKDRTIRHDKRDSNISPSLWSFTEILGLDNKSHSSSIHRFKLTSTDIFFFFSPPL